MMQAKLKQQLEAKLRIATGTLDLFADSFQPPDPADHASWDDADYDDDGYDGMEQEHQRRRLSTSARGDAGASRPVSADAAASGRASASQSRQRVLIDLGSDGVERAEYPTAAEAAAALREGKQLVGVRVTGTSGLAYAYRGIVKLGQVASPTMHSVRVSSLEKSHLNSVNSPQLPRIRARVAQELAERPPGPALDLHKLRVYSTAFDAIIEALPFAATLLADIKSAFDGRLLKFSHSAANTPRDKGGGDGSGEETSNNRGNDNSDPAIAGGADGAAGGEGVDKQLGDGIGVEGGGSVDATASMLSLDGARQRTLWDEPTSEDAHNQAGGGGGATVDKRVAEMELEARVRKVEADMVTVTLGMYGSTRKRGSRRQAPPRQRAAPLRRHQDEYCDVFVNKVVPQYHSIVMAAAKQVGTVEPGVAAVVHKLWHSLREILFRLVEQRESSAQLHTHAMTMARRTLDTLESARGQARVGPGMRSNMVVTGRGVELMTPKEHAVANQLALTQVRTAALRRRAAQVRAELTSLQERIAGASTVSAQGRGTPVGGDGTRATATDGADKSPRPASGASGAAGDVAQPHEPHTDSESAAGQLPSRTSRTYSARGTAMSAGPTLQARGAVSQASGHSRAYSRGRWSRAGSTRDEDAGHARMGMGNSQPARALSSDAEFGFRRMHMGVDATDGVIEARDMVPDVVRAS